MAVNKPVGDDARKGAGQKIARDKPAGLRQKRHRKGCLQRDRNKLRQGKLRNLLTLEENMKRTFLFACIGLFAVTTASAQNPPAKDGPNNNAVNSSGQNNSNAPVAGRNSFTEGQAKSKIEDAGYTNVTELKKDDNGIWRGKAKKGGSAMTVSVDFQGNVNTAK